jgi:hypothetical protein
MSRKVILIILCLVLLIPLALGAGFLTTRRELPKTESTTTPDVQKYSRIDIELKDGGIATSPSTYLVNKGTNLEFHITSNKFGKIGVPTEPAQTITFTESPLVFKFSAPTNPGSFALTYQPEGKKEVVLIGTIVVRN